MKRRARLSGEKLIMDYLGRVTEAALYYLPKGSRVAFVGRTKAQIERECGPAGLADPARVMEVLAALGEPEELVRQERTRIDAAWIKSTFGDRNLAQAAAAAINTPRKYRSITSRWKPATDTQPLPRPTDAKSMSAPIGKMNDAGDPFAADEAGKGQPETSPSPSSGSAAASEAGPGPGSAAASEAGPGSGSAAASEAGPGSAAPDEDAPSARSISMMRLASGAARFAVGQLVPRVAQLSRTVTALARAHVREAIAVVVIGVGGLIYPFPVWLVGATVALMSVLWGKRDKWVAFAGPLVIALLGAVVTAAVKGGSENAVVVYVDVVKADIGILLRIGCLLSAAFLAWRLYRDPRQKERKRPPWERYR